MGSIPQSPSTKTLASSTHRERNTGFPEPFCGNRNTTLPHPDAIISPDATISAENISVSRVMDRSRRSFLSNKYKRTLSYGRLSPEEQHQQLMLQQHQQQPGTMYSDSAVLDSDAESPTLAATPFMASRVVPIGPGRPSSKDSYEEERSSSSAHGEHHHHHHAAAGKDSSLAAPPSSPSSTSSRRLGVFRRLGFRRD